ncbi:MAG: hypothetical protein GTO29_11350 [Candidatus Latescibacteria bacterium]|nr:hypothetical protein [Candidatus Latescibacterota bacterium]NIO56760.1 hypothetical protein [Candidatus Latescibacterota bacterium]NIT02345.1 hypothetical protein [Candidatus Latescibacterota bacterium]NIT39228.1 hypothetical protein [Candidatus Latescibacterota bacterium]
MEAQERSTVGVIRVDDKWKVDQPNVRMIRGKQIRFDNTTGKTMHLQFPPALFQDPAGTDVEYKILEPGSFVELTVVSDAIQTIQRGNRVSPPHYYAVFITPDNVYAGGSNPPPEIDVEG